MGDTTRSTRPERPPTPWWVKVFGIVALVLGVLVVLKLAGVMGEGHGPGRHGGAPPRTGSLILGAPTK